MDQEESEDSKEAEEPPKKRRAKSNSKAKAEGKVEAEKKRKAKCVAEGDGDGAHIPKKTFAKRSQSNTYPERWTAIRDSYEKYISGKVQGQVWAEDRAGFQHMAQVR